MSAAQVVALVYAIGVAAGFVVVGATGAKFWNEGDPGPAFLPFVWPLGAPWALGAAFRARAKRRALAAEEKRKWLEAPIP